MLGWIERLIRGKQEEPLCPIIDQPCARERCAWFNQHKEVCSILVTEDYIRATFNQLQQANDKLAKLLDRLQS